MAQGIGNRHQKELSAEPPKSSAAAQSIDMRIIALLWVRMTQIYGHRWISAYGESSDGGAAHTWARGLAGIGQSGVAKGVEACLCGAHEWPPTLPEFRAMCLGIPSIHIVIAEIYRTGGATPSAFSRLVWQHIDAYRFRRISADDAEKDIRRAYDIAKAHVMAGGELPPDPVAMIERTQSTYSPPASSPEVALSALRQMAEVLR